MRAALLGSSGTHYVGFANGGVSLATIAVPIITKHDRVVLMTAGGVRLFGELAGIYWQLIRGGEKLSTTRESIPFHRH